MFTLTKVRISLNDCHLVPQEPEGYRASVRCETKQGKGEKRARLHLSVVYSFIDQRVKRQMTNQKCCKSRRMSANMTKVSLVSIYRGICMDDVLRWVLLRKSLSLQRKANQELQCAANLGSLAHNRLRKLDYLISGIKSRHRCLWNAFVLYLKPIHILYIISADHLHLIKYCAYLISSI